MYGEHQHSHIVSHYIRLKEVLYDHPHGEYFMNLVRSIIRVEEDIYHLQSELKTNIEAQQCQSTIAIQYSPRETTKSTKPKRTNKNNIWLVDVDDDYVPEEEEVPPFADDVKTETPSDVSNKVLKEQQCALLHELVDHHHVLSSAYERIITFLVRVRTDAMEKLQNAKLENAYYKNLLEMIDRDYVLSNMNGDLCSLFENNCSRPVD